MNLCHPGHSGLKSKTTTFIVVPENISALRPGWPTSWGPDPTSMLSRVEGVGYRGL